MIPIYKAIVESIRNWELVAVVTVLSGEAFGKKMLVWSDNRTLDSLGSEEMSRAAVNQAKLQLAALESGRTEIPAGDGVVDLFIEVCVPPSRLIIVGAAHIAIPLVALAKIVGFYTIVVDARRAFATRERFPHVDELIIDWPASALEKLKLDETTYISVISHDEKLDNPALKVALESPARYIGALGSIRTHAKRVQTLREIGVSEEQLARIHAPIGIELGAKTTEEIALAILAEIVGASHGIN
ncbi:MAG: XdhC family protein [Anaerolineaceae bacterium]|nr:XdhC family protein [Anaerolineaceae bacterium]